jgi:DNA repair exonuclease SbcCD ATPase subunit
MSESTPLISRQPPRPPLPARRACEKLEGKRETLQRERDQLDGERRVLVEYLAVADEIRLAMDAFLAQLFGELVEALQSQLTRALQDVLDQPIELKVERNLVRGAPTLTFYVERAGKREDIMKGQGGSVVNILSVGLRLLALSAVDEKQHRKFLILDEQDCWLRPDLVPRLVNIVHEAGKRMGFQVLMISHHDPAMFEKYADRIYRCRPQNDANGSYVLVEKSPATRMDASDLDKESERGK